MIFCGRNIFEIWTVFNVIYHLTCSFQIALIRSSTVRNAIYFREYKARIKAMTKYLYVVLPLSEWPASQTGVLYSRRKVSYWLLSHSEWQWHWYNYVADIECELWPLTPSMAKITEPTRTFSGKMMMSSVLTYLMSTHDWSSCKLRKFFCVHYVYISMMCVRENVYVA